MNTSIHQNLSQTTSIAPQQIFGLTLLAAPLAELRSLVRAEVEKNPTIEEVSSDEIDKALDILSNGPSFPDYSDPSEPPDTSVFNAESFGPDQDKVDFIYDSITSPVSLQEHLRAQAQLYFSPPLLPIAYDIIGNINDDGRYEGELYSFGSTPDEVLRSIKLNFSPKGVGARNLCECILLQLPYGTLQYVIVDRFFNELCRRQILLIATALGTTEANVLAALAVIRSTNPFPGRQFYVEPNIYVAPDAYLLEDLSGYYAVINERDTPKIKFVDHYRAMLLSPHTNQEVREWIKNKIRDGKLLAKSIENRASTLSKVIDYVVEKQKNFFSKGAEGLVPLTLKEVADAISLHETTISRAVNGKYIETPKGLFELKFFFNSSASWTTEGVSSASVRETIRNMIAKETTPLSDDEIVLKLKERGVILARRTVAKYRMQMNIPPYNERAKK